MLQLLHVTRFAAFVAVCRIGFSVVVSLQADQQNADVGRRDPGYSGGLADGGWTDFSEFLARLQAQAWHCGEIEVARDFLALEFF